ncbi:MULTISPECIES: SOS response-associated peptidase [unclassified Phyllobacterium]|uniref:SOS response-associated peptidase n=1 Tax=unclassified Phyllobacterium TaxID=2638441 RepID=UPI0030131B22
MCNLYKISTGFDAVRNLFNGIGNRTNITDFNIDIYPDYPAPVARQDESGELEVSMLRWGMPTPPAFIKGEVDYGVTNIRNVKSPHWRRWLGPESRCIVPATSFSEYGQVRDPVTKKLPLYWFALNEEQPLFWFAGIWTPWFSMRKKKEGPVQADIFAFLTTDANELVKPIHPKAMPVILRTREELDIWMNAPAEEALQLQRPLPDNDLVVLAPPKKIEEEPLLL